MAKNSNSSFQESDSAKGETTDPGMTMPSSQEMAVPRILVRHKEGEVKFRPVCKDGHQGVELLRRAIGAEDLDFLQGILAQLTAACTRKGIFSQADFNFMLSVIKGKKPRDQIEAMHATQMAVLQLEIMRIPGQLASCDDVIQLNCLGNLLSKLTRAFATHMDILQRYRSGSEQNVTIQNVSVSEGGQAIVGNVTQTDPNLKNTTTTAPPAAIADARSTPMPIIEQAEQPAGVNAKRRADR